MTFDIDALTLSNVSLGLLIGAAILLVVGLGLFFLRSRGLGSMMEASFLFGVCAIIAGGLFGAGIRVHTEAENDQVDTISAHINELPGVDSFVPPEKTRVILFIEREENSIPVCNSSTDSTTIILSVLTEDGESVDGHLIVSPPKDGACTYELKLQAA